MKSAFTQHSTALLRVALLLFLTFSAGSVFAQMQVANFSTGKVGTKTYEHFSFYVNSGARSEISYAYGKEGRSGDETKLEYLGRETVKGQPAFKIAFLNNQVLYVIPQKTYLKVVNDKGTYSKIFRWEYEGPVNGVGTWCEPCTQNGKDSVALVKQYFF